MLLGATSSSNRSFCGRAHQAASDSRFPVHRMRPPIANRPQMASPFRGTEMVPGLFALSVVYLTTDATTSQSRPKPRGGSIAWSSERSSSTIARKASAVLSRGLDRSGRFREVTNATRRSDLTPPTAPLMAPGCPRCAGHRQASRFHTV